MYERTQHSAFKRSEYAYLDVWLQTVEDHYLHGQAAAEALTLVWSGQLGRKTQPLRYEDGVQLWAVLLFFAGIRDANNSWKFAKGRSTFIGTL